METVCQLHITVSFETDMHTGIIDLTNWVISLKENVDTLYDYIRSLPAILTILS